MQGSNQKLSQLFHLEIQANSSLAHTLESEQING